MQAVLLVLHGTLSPLVLCMHKATGLNALTFQHLPTLLNERAGLLPCGLPGQVPSEQADSLLCWRHTSCAKHMFLLLVLKNFPVTLENLILLLSQWFCVVVSVCRIILFLRCLFYYKNNPVAANSLLKDIFFCKFLRVVCKILIKF